ncbi:MAG: hypothetical protein K2P81_02855 [Bacteriovoracaceae bacterium]|nr:hypothetical protein [Bacteriovoracaceae bacterium]
MKTLFTFMLLLPTMIWAQVAQPIKANIVLRDASFKARISSVELPYLISDTTFDGQFFKVVQGKNDEAISLTNEDEELVLRAATTYYHLNLARDWYVNKMKSTYVANLPKLVIRVDIKNQFNELGHYANDALDPQFNNALTIPAGEGLAGRGIKPWNMEIWFRPVKKVNIKDLKIKGDAMGEWGSVLASFRQQMHMSTLQRFLAQLVQSQTNPSPASQDFFGWENLIRVAGTSIMLEAVYQFADPLSRAFSRKWFWLDTALVPEIIYHEFSHVALSDHLVLSHSTAVIEGMADYFAGEIANSPNLATRIKTYNTFNGKKATRKQQYSVQFETTDYANSDFVFGMLWDLKTIVGDDSSPEFVYSLREKIDTNSSIRKQLIEGILKTCEEKCELPFVDKLKILQRYNARGI